MKKPRKDSTLERRQRDTELLKIAVRKFASRGVLRWQENEIIRAALDQLVAGYDPRRMFDIRSKRGAPPVLQNNHRNFLIGIRYWHALKTLPRKRALDEVAKLVGLSGSHVYKIARKDKRHAFTDKNIDWRKDDSGLDEELFNLS